MKIAKNWYKVFILAIIIVCGVFAIGFHKSKKSIPIFMYHCIEETLPENVGDEQLYVKPEEFRKQVAFWNENGYESKFVHELDLTKQPSQKQVVITFDDGYEDNYLYAYPILKEYNMKATIFVVAGLINKEGHLTSEQIKEMSDSGLISIQSHTLNHLDLSSLSAEELENELKQSKEILEECTGKPVTALSYPYGSCNENVIEKAKNYYDIATITFQKKPFNVAPHMQIERIGVFRVTQLDELAWITKKYC